MDRPAPKRIPNTTSRATPYRRETTNRFTPRPRYENPAGGRTGRSARRLSSAASIQPSSTIAPTTGMIRMSPVSSTLRTHSGSRDGQAMLSDSSFTPRTISVRRLRIQARAADRTRALTQQVPGDHHALDLVRALVDLRDLG